MIPKERYVALEHTTDAYLEAYGLTLEEAFGNAAYALMSTLVDINRVEKTSEGILSAEGHDLEGLLYNWLEIVLLRATVDMYVINDFDVRITRKGDDFELTAKTLGEILVPEKHHPKIEIKAATYHQMEIKKADGKYVLRFILDL